MQKWRMLAIVIATIPAGSAIAAPIPLPLAATTKWVMDYAPSECRLRRSFGDGTDRVTLQIGRLDVNDLLEIALAGSRMPATDGDVAATVSTTTVAQVPGMHASGFTAERDRPGIIRFRPDRDFPAALRSDVAANQPTHLSLRLGHRYAVQLELGSMKGALAALDTCMDDLVTSWGLDPAEQRRRAHPPEPANDLANWFSSNDYPEGLSRGGIGGIVIVRLIVGIDGAVKKCAVAKAGGDKAFEDLTCKIATTRARFRPAEGADGKPIASVWIRRIEWRPGGPSFFWK